MRSTMGPYGTSHRRSRCLGDICVECTCAGITWAGFRTLPTEITPSSSGMLIVWASMDHHTDSLISSQCRDRQVWLLTNRVKQGQGTGMEPGPGSRLQVQSTGHRRARWDQVRGLHGIESAALCYACPSLHVSMHQRATENLP